jgi:hypothetical protein
MILTLSPGAGDDCVRKTGVAEHDPGEFHIKSGEEQP